MKVASTACKGLSHVFTRPSTEWRIRRSSSLRVWVVVLIILCVVLLVANVIVDKISSRWTADWRHLLSTMSSCQNRVTASQQVLFTPQVYFTQYNIVSTEMGERLFASDEHRVENIALSKQGFRGNPHIYGLGIRLGLYFQWSACLLANHLLSYTPTKMLQAYSIVMAAMIGALFKISIEDSCNFSIEAIIVYHMLFYGILIVFSQTNMLWGNLPKSSKANTWIQVIKNLLITVSLGHMVWFWSLGYNWYFMTMPYETTHFMFGPVKQETITKHRDFLKLWFCSILVQHLCIIMLATIWFSKGSIKSTIGSESGRRTFPSSQNISSHHLQTPKLLQETGSKMKQVHSIFQKELQPFVSAYTEIPHTWRPQDHRWRTCYAMFSAVVACGSFVYAITAIECIIYWNNISGVNSLDSAWQFIPIIIGICSLVAFLNELMKDRNRPKADHQGQYHSITDSELQQIPP